ncbi:MAG: histidine--tRNA ligase [Candidatus Spechtbacterales bacterium]
MAKQPKFQTPLGTHDILPSEQYWWQQFRAVAESVATSYGFGRIDTPILEFSELFEKGTGQDTDIVLKEMFRLKTRGGAELTLRPEGTPPVARAYIQHGMEKWTSPVKLYYIGPMFRHEKPQRGRRRQLHQFGLEVFGEEDAARDVQVILAFFRIFEKLKLKDVRLEINTLGSPASRTKYQKVLREYYKPRVKQLGVEWEARLKSNPLRLLDSDDEKALRIRAHAPQILDYLTEEDRAHFREVLELLDTLEIPYFLNPYLVRGLDYYTRTVFEVFQGSDTGEAVDEDGNAVKRLAIAAGGRYDELVKQLGGGEVPAVGGAIGIERTLDVLRAQSKGAPQQEPTIFLVQLGDRAKKQALLLYEEFRKAGVSVGEAFGRGSITAQLKVANKVGAPFAIILGQKEVLDHVVIIREMETGTQETVPEEKLVREIKKRLEKKNKKKGK